METYTPLNKNAFIYRIVFVRGIPSLILSLIVAFIFGVGGGDNTIFISTFFIILLITGGLSSLIVLLESKNIGFRLEQNTVHYREGIFSLRRFAIPFARITNVSYHQSIFQRMFSVGDLIVDQEDSEVAMRGIDSHTAELLLKAISEKSNIQPISNKSK